MTVDVKVSRVFKRDGDYCVNVKPKNAPEGSIGAGGKIERFDKWRETLTYKRLIKKLERTPTKDEVKFITKRNEKRTNMAMLLGAIAGLGVSFVAIAKGKFGASKGLKRFFKVGMMTSGASVIAGGIGAASSFASEKNEAQKFSHSFKV